MAEVYRAEGIGAEGVRKQVALKVVRADHLGSPALVARFVREARAAALLGLSRQSLLYEMKRLGIKVGLPVQAIVKSIAFDREALGTARSGNM